MGGLQAAACGSAGAVHTDSVAVGHVLRCSVHAGPSRIQDSPVSPAMAGGFYATEHQGSPDSFGFNRSFF